MHAARKQQSLTELPQKGGWGWGWGRACCNRHSVEVTLQRGAEYNIHRKLIAKKKKTAGVRLLLFRAAPCL